MKVFDASAILAVIFDEPGAALATQWMNDGDALVSSVNLTEVWTRMLDMGMSQADATAVCQQMPLFVEPFTRAQAERAGLLRPATRHLGLSLGDRCCLALAEERGATAVVTADRPWAQLPRFNISLIR